MKNIYPYLAFAGAVPFVVSAVCLSYGVQEFPFLGSIEKTLSVYALVIITFLAGSHWGQHLHLKGIWICYLPILSNILVVLLWLAFLVLPFRPLLAIYGAAFGILLFTDQRLFQGDLITRQYFRTRCHVTAIVILTLIILGIAT